MAEFKSASQINRGENNDAHENTWKPMATRIEFAGFEESFIGNKFPYDANILAKALQELVNREEAK